MSNYKEHAIGKETKGFQIVYEDTEHKEIIIWANFKWKNNSSNKIMEVDFILKNIQNVNIRFKIHKVFFCEKYERIEVHLSRHKDFKDVEYDAIENQILEIEMSENQKIKMILRVTMDSRTYSSDLECSNIDQGIHHDQDGSILVGKRP